MSAYAKFYWYNDKRWMHVRTIKTTSEKIDEVMNFVVSKINSNQYMYELFRDELLICTIHTFDNCLFD